MGTTQYFEDELFPPDGDGRANESKPSALFQIMVSNFHGDHQIFLRLNDEENGERNFHLTKIQAKHLSGALSDAATSIGYDNSGPLVLDHD